MKHYPLYRYLGAALVTTGIALSATSAFATHSWGGYHWARTNNPFTLKLGDNLSNAWDPYLVISSNDWTASTVLNTTIVTGQGRSNCRATSGRVEVCNAKYGNNGWLGIAQVWVSGTHITQGIVKMNDTYFAKPSYNTPAWKNLVLCQEVGHTFGLDHQDESFSNASLGMCMDYTNDPTPNQHPNAHDYAMLETIYAHLDTSTTLSADTVSGGRQDIDVSDPPAWGKAIEHDSKGRPSKFEKDLGNGRKVHTFVVWAD